MDELKEAQVQRQFFWRDAPMGPQPRAQQRPEVPDFNIDLLGHGYFAQAQALLYDIRDLMRHGEPPKSRQRIEPAAHQGVSFWKLRR